MTQPETEDDRIARKVWELLAELKPEGIVLGSLTLHFHEARLARYEVKESVSVRTSVDHRARRG